MSSSANNYVQINDIQIGRKPSVWEILSNENNFKWMLIVPLLMVLSFGADGICQVVTTRLRAKKR